MSEEKINKRAATAASRLNAYRRLFSTEDGQLVLKDLMSSCGVLTPVIGKDTHDTYFNEGARSVILRILNTINMTEKDVEKVMIEMNRNQYDMLN